jgi:hypothetical protein
MPPHQRRSLLRLGALFLLLGMVLGILTALPVPYPAKWMAAHLTAVLGGAVLIGQGLIWPDLRLTDRQRSVALACTKTSAWAGLSLNLAGAVLGIPGPATNPGVQPAGLQAVVLIALLLVIVPTMLTSGVLIWYGLRGRE